MLVWYSEISACIYYVVSLWARNIFFIYKPAVFVLITFPSSTLLLSPPSSSLLPPPSSTCQLSAGRLSTALSPPLSPTPRRGILNVQVWPNISVAVRCCFRAMESILSSLCCCSLYPGMHSLFFKWSLKNQLMLNYNLLLLKNNA